MFESDLRELLEQGSGRRPRRRTVGPRRPEWGDGYKAAMINYRLLAHALLSTEETLMDALSTWAACLRPCVGWFWSTFGNG